MNKNKTSINSGLKCIYPLPWCSEISKVLQTSGKWKTIYNPNEKETSYKNIKKGMNIYAWRSSKSSNEGWKLNRVFWEALK